MDAAGSITVSIQAGHPVTISTRVLLRVVRCERRTPVTANVNCRRAWPMGIHATLMLTPRCSPGGPRSEPMISSHAVTNGGGEADMRRTNTRHALLEVCVWASFGARVLYAAVTYSTFG